MEFRIGNDVVEEFMITLPYGLSLEFIDTIIAMQASAHAALCHHLFAVIVVLLIAGGTDKLNIVAHF